MFSSVLSTPVHECVYCLLFEAKHLQHFACFMQPTYEMMKLINIGRLCFPYGLVLRKYYEGWNFNSGNYLFTTDTK